MESIGIALIYELGPADDGSYLGGIESHILSLARHLARDHDVTLLTGMIPGSQPRSEMYGFDLIRSDVLGLVQRSWNPTNLTTQRQLFSIPAFLRDGAKIDADIYHGHIYASGVAALQLAGSTSAKAINTIHGSYYDHWEEITGSGLKAAAYRLGERLLATYLSRNCSRQIHTATDFAQKVERWGGPHDHLRVILNGVDTDKFSPRVEPTLGRGERPTVMTVRRLVPKNGVRYFVEARRHLETDADFIIVGDGPERRRLEELSLHLGVTDRVEFAGPIPNQTLPGILASADVVVVPSLVEASSISLLEAMAMGKPTVVTNIPGIDEVASPQRSLMIPPADPQSLARSVDTILSNPGEYGRLGKRAREYVVSHRSDAVVAARTLEVYREALGS
jgi:glycosyltransferase involved in cell wall biosynthesis